MASTAPMKPMKEKEELTRTNPFLDTGKRTIPVICPWCNKVFRVAKWKVEDGARTSPTHGICPDCLKKVGK